MVELTVDTAEGRYSIHGDAFHRNLLSVLLTLRRQGVELTTTQWFYYGCDEMLDAPSRAHLFFIVADDDRIVANRAVLFEHATRKEFRPEVLTSHAESLERYPPVWLSDAVSLARLWYPRFYQDTTAGQLMVVNPDEPKLSTTRVRRDTMATPI